MKAMLKAPVVIDLRNIYDPRQMADAGFHYSCIGRPCPPLPGMPLTSHGKASV
jgi:UDPglucose 6-dehydrogenase